MASSRDSRSQVTRGDPLNVQESLPFLDPAEGDFGVELQHVDRDHGYSDSNHTHFDSVNGTGEDIEEQDFYEATSHSAELRTPRHRKSVFQRLLPRWLSRLVDRSPGIGIQANSRTRKRRIRPVTAILRVVAATIMLLGLIQLATLLLGVLTAFFPERLDHAFRTWRHEDLDGLSRWPTDYTADINPVACHSHNDYWRRVPLQSAIKAGCTSVEADVWLFKDDLYVGHAESALVANRTLSTLYVHPLVQILDRQNPITDFQSATKMPRNGIFDVDPSQTLVLLIDFKTDFERLWPVVREQLEPLRQRQYLTHFNGTTVVQGPITVVVTGNAPFDYVVANMRYRDMFFDAPLDMMESLSNEPTSPTYDPSIEREYLASISTTSNHSSSSQTPDQNQGQGHSGHPPTNPHIFSRANSYFASVNFKASIGWPQPYLSPAQRDKMAAQIAGAHSRGLKVRYWGVPNWPIGLRNYLWRELVKMGVDYLNVDDLYAATKGDWKSGYSIWDWSLWGGSDW